MSTLRRSECMRFSEDLTATIGSAVADAVYGSAGEFLRAATREEHSAWSRSPFVSDTRNMADNTAAAILRDLTGHELRALVQGYVADAVMLELENMRAGHDA